MDVKVISCLKAFSTRTIQIIKLRKKLKYKAAMLNVLQHL